MNYEIHYRLTDMPEDAIPPGSTVNVEVVAVEPLEDGALEVVMRYIDHY